MAAIYSARRIGALLIVALLTGGFFSAATAQVIAPYDGQETFDRFCASCHGETGRGDGPVAPALPIAVPDLTILRHNNPERFPAALLRKIIDGREIVVYHGTRYMPVWGYEFWIEEGADEEAAQRVEVIIDNLVAYIESIQR